MTAQTLEIFLARLYTDPSLRDDFLTSPHDILRNNDLSADEITNLLQMDTPGLLMASHSFARKRAHHASSKKYIPIKLTKIFNRVWQK